jgi:hypothetical protein
MLQSILIMTFLVKIRNALAMKEFYQNNIDGIKTGGKEFMLLK